MIARSTVRGPGSRCQRGAMLLTALMVMVLLGAIGAALTSTLGGQHAQVSQRHFERQTAYAAHGGAEWGRERARSGSCAGSTTVQIGGMPVTVRCTMYTVTEDAESYSVFHLLSEAQSGAYGDPAFVRRTVRARQIVR